MEDTSSDSSPSPEQEQSAIDQESEEASTTQSIDPTTSSVPPAPVVSPKKSHKKLNIILSILGGIFVLVIIVAIILFLVLKKEVEAPPVSNITTQTESEVIGTPTEVEVPRGEYSFIEPKILDTVVAWQEPSQIALMGLHKGEAAETPDNYDYVEGVHPVTYYLAGTFTGGKVVYSVSKAGSLEESSKVFLIRDGEKALYLYRYEQQFVTAETYSSLIISGNSLDPEKVTVDSESIFKNTLAPETVTIKGQKMSLPKYKNYLATDDTREYSNRTGSLNVENIPSEQVVATIPEGTIYELTTPKEGYSLSLFELEMPNHFRVSYEIDGELSNADVQPITWTDGSRNTAMYESFGAGCGGGRYSLVANLTKNELTQIGNSDGKQPIYIFKDMNQIVAAKIMSEVNARGSYENYIKETDPKYTAEEFLKDRAVIIVEDGMGRWVVFKNLGNFLQGGCAKPVIYLYPEVPLMLNIQVGADVTVSEPRYETNGWQNVTALPNGQLFYRGLPYDSLFWEGLGHGTYPDKSALGVVVPRAEVVSTMYRQLAEQGFNQKESDDFVEFWSLNIPSEDYVRLTWLSTSEMNALAPLHLSTRPDTVIRTFLEMEGLNRPIALTLQKFSAPARNGFVVTEWGGLAVNGLHALVLPQ